MCYQIKQVVVAELKSRFEFTGCLYREGNKVATFKRRGVIKLDWINAQEREWADRYIDRCMQKQGVAITQPDPEDKNRVEEANNKFDQILRNYIARPAENYANFTAEDEWMESDWVSIERILNDLLELHVHSLWNGLYSGVLYYRVTRKISGKWIAAPTMDFVQLRTHLLKRYGDKKVEYTIRNETR